MKYTINVGTGRFNGEKPNFTHTETLEFTACLQNADETPFDLTGYSAQCAMKSNFIHGSGEQLIAYAGGDNAAIAEPESGEIVFRVVCRSTGFYKAVRFGARECNFEISLIPAGQTESFQIAFDSVRLFPRVQVDEGEPQQAGPEYPTFAQVNSLLDQREFAPGEGNPGDVLMKTANGQEWRNSLQKITLDGPIFTPQDRTIYAYTPAANDEIVFEAGTKAEFYLDITMPNPVVSFSFPASMVWIGQVPSFATAGATTTVQVLFDGTTYRASAYPDLSNCMPIVGTINKLNISYHSNYSNQTISYFRIGDTAYPTLNIGKGGTGHGATNLTFECLGMDIRPYNVADWGVKYNGHKMNQPGGFCLNDSNGDLTVPRFINSKGMQIIAPSSLTIAPKDNKVYKITSAGAITLDTSALTSGCRIAFVLLISQGATPAAITLPDNVTWTGTTPTCDAANTDYSLNIIWDGTRLIGWLEYAVANA